MFCNAAHFKQKPSDCRVQSDVVANHRARINSLLSANCMAGTFQLRVLYFCVVIFLQWKRMLQGLCVKALSSEGRRETPEDDAFQKQNKRKICITHNTRRCLWAQ